MADLPVWLDGGDHTCCGEPRHVGQIVRLALAFSRAGKVRATSEPDQITVPGDGTVTITGAAGGKTDIDGPFGHGTLIRSGSVQFAIHGNPPGRKVRCTGELYEARHGEPSGTTTGQLIAIRWRPQEALAYAPGIELRTTGDWRQHAPEDDPSAWAFEFTIRVSE